MISLLGPLIGSPKTLLVAFDTEYTRDKSGKKNIALSYQFCIANLLTGEVFQQIYYPDYLNEERLSFKEIILLVFKISGIKNSAIEGYNINFICHFSTAEWTMIRDRLEIAPYFENVRKSLITFKSKPVSFDNSDGDSCTITFDFTDTMLLLPPSHQSLEKATSLLDKSYQKIELSTEIKANMDKLLKEDKPTFEEYALHDAKVTLVLYLTLQKLLNDINETTNVRYTTIGSATVKHFKKFCTQNFDKGFFKTQFFKNRDDVKGYNLARRAYMGGLNSSYYVGEHSDGVFLDIDFSSAYPTVMNLLREGTFIYENTPVNNTPFSLENVS